MADVTMGLWPADGPIPQQPPHNLLSVPGVLLPQTDDEHWLLGVHLWPYPRDVPGVIGSCESGTFRLKDEPEDWNNSLFGPFTAYLGITCTTAVAKRPDFADRARLALQAREAYAVSLELAFGTANPTDPHLTDANVHILAGGAAVRADVGLSYLEDAIGATAQAGMIHATPAVATAWNGQSGYSVEDVGGTLYTTANKTPVAISYAYYGATPSGGTPAAAGESWVYATGPVQVRRQSNIQIIAPTLAQSMDRSDNVVTYRAERGFVVSYDAPEDAAHFRPVQAAVKVDWTP